MQIYSIGFPSMYDGHAPEDDAVFAAHIDRENFRRSNLESLLQQKHTHSDGICWTRSLLNEKYMTERSSDLFFESLFAARSYDETVIVKRQNNTASIYLPFFCNYVYRHRFLENFYCDNIFFSLDTYMPKGKKRHTKMFAKRGFGVVVDFKKANAFKSLTSVKMWEYVKAQISGKVPLPNFVLLADKIYMIYLPDSPAATNTDAGRRIARGMDALAAEFAARISDFGFPAAASDGFYPVPGSFCVKRSQSSMSYPIAELTHIKKKKVSWQQECITKYHIPHLIDEYLPKIPGYERGKDYGPKDPSRRVLPAIRDLQTSRIEDLKVVAKNCPSICKTDLLFIAMNAYYFLHGGNMNGVMDLVYEINSLFADPLDKKQVQRDVQTSILPISKNGGYRFKNSTIMNWLGLSEDNCRYLGLSLHMSVKDLEKQRRIDEGRTHEQRKAAKYEMMFPMFIENLDPDGMHFTNQEIADTTGYSIREVQRTRKVFLKMLEDGKDVTNVSSKTRDVLCPFVSAGAACDDLPEEGSWQYSLRDLEEMDRVRSFGKEQVEEQSACAKTAAAKHEVCQSSPIIITSPDMEFPKPVPTAGDVKLIVPRKIPDDCFPTLYTTDAA